MNIEDSIAINNSSIEPSFGALSSKATQMYKQAEKTFEEFGDYSCELDTLGNYYDFLEVADDDLLMQFSISYNAEPWEEDEDSIEYDEDGNPLGPGYKDPSIILTIRIPFFQLHITCRGYEFNDGYYIPCDVVVTNKHLARKCVEYIKEKIK
jgi:hypothetical protein